MYKTFYRDGTDEFIEKKSKFIGYGFRVKSEEEAVKKIEEIKKIHRDATHNCSAYIIGENKLIQRYNDDGEPSGTAGIPMLEVLKKEDVTNVLVMVTRYFGGILLGAGGLVRAYTKGAKIAVDSSLVVEMREYEKLSLKYDYTFHGGITNYLIKNGYKVLNEDYTDKVKIILHRDLNDNKIIEDLINETSAAIEIKKLGIEKLPFNDGKILY
ncbi:YigZ family protein [Peptoniphilus sp. oral taxon 386]|uniref:YigZ family protein n=1 Tax=Peptoniphilus sp. oral taxon 386 TaxID=652713 RepID=UPI0001DA9B05|nr:YigZ family protein [Peptoniphilus sp. oral taxon 386]EFI42079.1 YigZ family protein [Peptoniphilus sp. oral taxon 386 str. F0131]